MAHDAFTHENGLRGFFRDLEFDIITRAIKEYKTLSDAAIALKINRSTLSMKVISFEEMGYKFPPYGAGIKRGTRLIDDGSHFTKKST